MTDGGAPIRVRVVYSIPSPYQEQLFERVASHDGVDLQVLYCDERNPDRDWRVDLGDYSHEVMASVEAAGRRINPGVVRALARDKPDVVVIGGYAEPTMQLATLTAWALRVPVVLWCESHGRDWRNRRPDLRTRLKDVLLSGLVRGCGAFLTPGRLQQRYLADHGADPDNVFVGTHTCDVDGFREAADAADAAMVREEYGVTAGTVFSYVGRLIEEKGLREFVDAAASASAKHDDIGFIVAGSGPLEDELRRRCRDHGLDNMHFPGFVPRDELPALYGASDVFVFPSRGDPWGVVVNEAMSCGLPVITTDAVGAGYDLVGDGVNGAIVPPKDSAALSSAIERVLAVGPATMGRRSAQIMDHWTHGDAAASFVEAVERATHRDI